VRDGVARIGIGRAFLLGALGQVMTVVRGAEAPSFGVAAVLPLTGTLSRRRRVRYVAVVLAAGLGSLAWVGVLPGSRYQELLRECGQAEPVAAPDRGRLPVFARHSAFTAAPGELIVRWWRTS
jgi:hypothetical protein